MAVILSSNDHLLKFKDEAMKFFSPDYKDLLSDIRNPTNTDEILFKARNWVSKLPPHQEVRKQPEIGCLRERTLFLC